LAFVLTLHAYWRWLVLLAALVAVASAFRGRRGGAAERSGLLFTLSLDLQVLLGLILWVGRAEWTSNVFLAVLHPLAMLIAVALAHVGRSRAKRAAAQGTPGAAAGWLYIASLVVIALFIPRYSWHL